MELNLHGKWFEQFPCPIAKYKAPVTSVWKQMRSV